MRRSILAYVGRDARLHPAVFLVSPTELASSSDQQDNAWSAADMQCWQRRRYSDRQSMESQEHLVARLAHQEAMREMRTKWREEHLRQQHLRTKQLDQKQVRLQTQKQERAKRRQECKEARAAVVKQDVIQQQAVKEARLDKAARWRQAVMTVYRQLQEHRKAELITQSRDWIRPEDLDRRIEEVLNYPTKMFR